MFRYSEWNKVDLENVAGSNPVSVVDESGYCVQVIGMTEGDCWKIIKDEYTEDGIEVTLVYLDRDGRVVSKTLCRKDDMWMNYGIL